LEPRPDLQRALTCSISSVSTLSRSRILEVSKNETVVRVGVIDEAVHDFDDPVLKRIQIFVTAYIVASFF